MKIIKFYEKGRPEPPDQYAALIGSDEQGELLINYPVDKVYGKREARWISPKDYCVVWIKEFIDKEEQIYAPPR